MVLEFNGRVPQFVLATHGKFHTLDAAAALQRAGKLSRVFTGYPRTRLKKYGIERDKLTSLSASHTAFMAVSRLERFSGVPSSIAADADRRLFAKRVARRLVPADAFLGMSSSSLEAGRVARSQGTRFVIDRGSTHISHQDEVMRRAYEELQMPYQPILRRAIDRELQEYDEADHIVVPSVVCKQTFVARGISAAKVTVVPYGVELDHFYPDGERTDNTIRFLFVGNVSVRKQPHIVIDAFRKLARPDSSLSIVGPIDQNYYEYLGKSGRLGVPGVTFVGVLRGPQLRRAMSASHALILPSVEEGLALVQAQAMACGCPVIASTQTGATDLFGGSSCGTVVDNSDGYTDAMGRIAEDVEFRRLASRNARERVRQIGGWEHYASGLATVLAPKMGVN